MTENKDSDSGKDKEPCAKNTILIVDDETMVRKVFQRLLSISLPECKVDTANNGSEAVDSFSREHQRVILMDLHMPVMDGETAFRKIRDFSSEKNWEAPAVIFCTGYEPPHTIGNIVSEHPLHCLLRKPVTNDTLLEAVKLRLR
ncbi:MAG: response regulator [Kiritimatiellia bacterium]